jgi:hypothetical protein
MRSSYSNRAPSPIRSPPRGPPSHPSPLWRSSRLCPDDRRHAYAAWNLLWADLGQRLFAPTGTLALTGNGETWAARSAAVLAEIGKPMTELRFADLPRRFPQLDTGDHAFTRSGDPAGSRDASAGEIAPLLERCRRLLKGFAYWRINPSESLLLYRDGRRALRCREAGCQGLGDVPLLRPWLQVRRRDGTGACPHDCRGPRSRRPCTLGGWSGRR